MPQGMTSPTYALQRFLRSRDVQHVTGLPESSLYAMIAAGRFPKPIKLSEQRVAWLESDVAKWQASVLAANNRGAATDG